MCQHGFSHRTRFWESAERLSRHGEVDGVAIITLVQHCPGGCPAGICLSSFTDEGSLVLAINAL